MPLLSDRDPDFTACCAAWLARAAARGHALRSIRFLLTAATGVAIAVFPWLIR